MSDSSNLHDAIADSLRRHRVPGASIGLYRGGAMDVWPFGVSLASSGQPVVPGMIYRLASVTKPMLASAVMTLASNRGLDLDRPVAEWFRTHNQPRWFRSVTPRHLLSHIGGIDCEVPFNLRSLGNGPAALERAIEAFDQVEQWTVPGEVMSYANTGYWLLGRILELETGASFEEAMRTLLFGPIGMTTACFSSDQAILQPVAVGHNDAGNGPTPIRTFSYPRARRPSGGVIASAEDVLRFAAWHLRPDNAIAHEMRQPVTMLRQIDGEAWGVGWALRSSTEGVDVIGHGGSFDGYKSQLTLVPDRQMALVILTNSDRGNFAIREIERTLLRHLEAIELPDSRPTEGFDLEPYMGTFVQPHATIRIDISGASLVATTSANTLGMRHQREETSRFAPLDPMTFVGISGPQTGAKIDFMLDSHSGLRHWLRSGLRVARRTE